MPAESKAQFAFAAMSRTAKGRAALRKSGKKPMPADVGKEFTEATGSTKNLPQHVRKK